MAGIILVATRTLDCSCGIDFFLCIAVLDFLWTLSCALLERKRHDLLETGLFIKTKSCSYTYAAFIHGCLYSWMASARKHFHHGQVALES